MDRSDRYASFGEFYPFYLTEHVNPVSRRLHVAGTGLVIAILAAAVLTLNPWCSAP